MDDLRPVDFSTLDPYADPGRRARAAAGVVARAAWALQRRPARGPLGVLEDWFRPALAAAAAVAALSLGVHATSSRGADALPGTVAQAELAGVPEALGLGEPLPTLAVDETRPTSADLLTALEDLP